ncbi:MAG TPA: hypothetical protein VLR69_16265, partial [Thermoanaerobaculia bacterium]|nr:hypothetical protein [Thermoanaerobaculia bacterium]
MNNAETTQAEAVTVTAAAALAGSSTPSPALIWDCISERNPPLTNRSILSRRTLLVVFLLATVLPATVLAQPPIDSWTFDELNGSIAHNSISGRADGTLINGAVFVPGVAGNAVDLPPFAS